MTDLPRELSEGTSTERLTHLMRILRSEDGCPWDREQSFETIAPYTIEEAYEVADAISRGNMADLKEELGDLLFQVIFHSRMAEEDGAFTYDDVAEGLLAKMIRRHPHVFSGGDDHTAEQQTKAWETLKAEERAQKASGAPASILSDVPVNLPALLRAEKLQKRAARVGFDWPAAKDVLDKMVEEASEIAEAQAEGASQDKIEEEMGDLLFVVANLARKMKIDPETALRKANEKFIRRFTYIEDEMRRAQTDIATASRDEMEALWVEAKLKEKSAAD